MKSNKICFIHLRLTQPDHKARQMVKASKGGATVAWTIASNGDIHIGAPAMCSIKDHYVKIVGRDVAKANLESKVAFVIPAAQLVEDATARLLSEAESIQSSTKPLLNEITKLIVESVAKDINSAMSSHWFEAQVHNSFTVSNDGNDAVFQFNGQDDKYIIRNAMKQVTK